MEIKEERAFYEEQSSGIATVILVLASFVGFVMGVGAVFGAMNTMYAIVSARTREIGTLRALGFRRWSVMVSFVLESVLLALVGGLVGCLLALPANLLTTSTGGANFSEVAFAFRITNTALLVGLGFALAMGLVGGLLPAFRAATAADHDRIARSVATGHPSPQPLPAGGERESTCQPLRFCALRFCARVHRMPICPSAFRNALRPTASAMAAVRPTIAACTCGAMVEGDVVVAEWTPAPHHEAFPGHAERRRSSARCSTATATGPPRITSWCATAPTRRRARSPRSTRSA